MNGPAHYAEAERAIKLAEDCADDGGYEDGMIAVGVAQAHATLALAWANTALAQRPRTPGSRRARQELEAHPLAP